MSPVISHFSDLDLSKSYTYADYLCWQFSEMVELIKGKVVKMSPAPGSFHQTVSVNLSIILGNRLKKSSCRLFAAHSDVRLICEGKNDEQIVTVVQPDLFMVCDISKIDEKGCLGSPDLVIEIYLLENGKYRFTGHFISEDNIPVHSVPGFSLPVIEVFEW